MLKQLVIIALFHCGLALAIHRKGEKRLDCLGKPQVRSIADTTFALALLGKPVLCKCCVMALQVCAWLWVCMYAFCYERIYFAVRRSDSTQEEVIAGEHLSWYLHLQSASVPELLLCSPRSGLAGRLWHEMERSPLKFRLQNWGGFSTLAVQSQPPSTDARPRKQTAPHLPAAPPQSQPPHSHRGAHLLLSCTSSSRTQNQVRPGAVLQRFPANPPRGSTARGRSRCPQGSAPCELESRESEQRPEGNFKCSSRTGRNIYTPAFSNMLHFLTL